MRSIHGVVIASALLATLACNRLSGSNTAAVIPAHVDKSAACPSSPAVQVDVGELASCAALADGHACCWGSNEGDSLAIGDPLVDKASKPRLVQHLDDVAQIAMLKNGREYCARRTDGAVLCWGEPADGPTVTMPTAVEGLSGVQQLVAGDDQFCALLGDGSLRCWGRNPFGQLGDGSTTNRAKPVAVSALRDVATVGCGHSYCCAATHAGTVSCWGAKPGSMGNEVHATPVPIEGVSDVKTLFVGGARACAVLGDESVWCWGENTYGELGEGVPRPHADAPADAKALRGAKQIALSHGGAAFVDESGACLARGQNMEGALGVGDAGLGDAVRGRPEKCFAGAVQVALGALHSCARAADGSIACAGANDYGQLGNGSVAESSSDTTPTPVAVVGIGGGK